MHALVRFAREVNLAALAVLAILFLALLLGGANDALRAALLSTALLAALAIAALAAPQEGFARVLSSNWLTLVAGAMFALLGLASAFVGIGDFAHPFWLVLDEGRQRLSLSPYRTLEGLAAFLAPAAAYFLGALLAPGREARDWAGRWLIVLSIPYALIGLSLYFSQGGGRLDVGISSANAAAALFGMIALGAVTLMVRAARGRLGHGHRTELPAGWRWAGFALRAPLSFAALILMLSCLLLTASRGGLIAVVIGFVFFGAAIAAQALRHAGARSGALLAPVLLVAAVFALLFLRGGEEVAQRFALAGEDWEVRRTIADEHWRMFLERPLLGHGLNTYHELNTLAARPENWAALRNPGSTHNIFIQALEETGLVGLGLWALMLATPLWRALSRIAWRRSGAEWAACAFAAASVLLLHGLVDFALQVPAIAALFAFLLGMSVGRSQRPLY